ncbi:MAG: lipopolysaccharide/colanic/teichoic acid biosynthesis glycosyltransferase [Limisphaerales bacterium]
MNKKTLHITVFEKLPTFLTILQSKGILIDIDNYSKVLKVFEHTEHVQQLKTRLCPLLVKDAKEQSLFYQLFEEFFSQVIPDMVVENTDQFIPPKAISPTEEATPSKSFSTAILQLYWQSIQTRLFRVLFTIFSFVATIAAILYLIPTLFENYLVQTLVVTALLAVIALDYFLKRRDQKLIVKRIKSKQAPYYWQLDLNLKDQLKFGREIANIAKQFRKRIPGNRLFLNVKKTLLQTISNAGAFHLNYDYSTKPAEYLLLIDNTSTADHQTHLFEWLYQLLNKNNVYIERYYFKDDPQICWNERDREGVSIEKLSHRFKDYRLIIFGQGWKMINADGQGLMEWTSIFKTWKNRVILTPKSNNDWSYEELNLSQLFTVLPSDIEGLLKIVDYFDPLKSATLYNWKAPNLQSIISIDENNVVDYLTHHFSKPIQYWISACSVFPGINWGLTLYLGEKIAEYFEEDILTYSNVLLLAQLPWFKNGHMPDHVRVQLIELLYEDLRLDIHESLVTIMEKQHNKNPLPANSYAFSQFKLQLAVHKLQSGKFQNKEQEIKKELEALIKEGIEHDFLAIHTVRSLSKEDFELPAQFRSLQMLQKRRINSSANEYRMPLGKRLFDIFFAYTTILLLSPLLLIVTVSIAIESKGPIIFRSKRVGTGYQVFDFLKFRSMCQVSDFRFKTTRTNQTDDQDEVRITTVGKFIRKTSLDELPQLFNVLKGDMSIVGNRPLTLHEVAALPKEEYADRFYAPAGITGLWQVASEGKDNLTFDQRMALDIEYARNYSFVLDLKIMLRTLPTMIQAEENILEKRQKEITEPSSSSSSSIKIKIEEHKIDLIEVERRNDLTRTSFGEEYLNPRIPVVFTNLMDSWPAKDKWTFEYFKEFHGDLIVPVYTTKMYKPGKQYMSPTTKMPLREFLDILEEGPTDLRLFLFNIFRHATELVEDFSTPTIMDGFIDNLPFMFFGGKGSKVNLHFDIDLSHVFLNQFHGRKRVVLFPPEQSKNLYQHPFTVNSPINIEQPDFEKFPFLKNVQGYESILHPGESLFIPSGYWHYFEYLDAGCSLSLRANESYVRRAKGMFNIARHFVVDKGMNKLLGDQWMEIKERLAKRRVEDDDLI